MATQIIKMPDTDGSGDVVEFCIQIGDAISEGDSILVLESDKASMEVPSDISGSLVEWMVSTGDTVETGTPLAVIEVAESVPAVVAEAPSELIQPVSGRVVEFERAPVSVEPNKLASPTPAVARDTSILVNSGPVYAGPATRKLARELGVDLSLVMGTGKRSRIIKGDVKQFVKSRMTNPVQTMAVGSGIPAIPAQDFSRFGEIDTVDLSGIAKATFAHMTRCWLNIPHVTLFDEADVTDLEAFRKMINPDQHGLDKKPSILPFIVMFAARALRKYPQFNSSLHPNGEQIIYKDYVNIGVAVDTPAGLVVPVIKDADKKSISELTQAIQTLAAKARGRKLKPEDMQGGCFTVSSLGASGGTGFTPIINGPEVAILGVAKSAIKPVWDGAEFQPRQQLPLCLSFDHRVINGADAGRFMAMLNQCLSHMGNALL
jgi:pyruvate dehydrogenase E2 component (dihydrolipoamide acetyltransferase)